MTVEQFLWIALGIGLFSMSVAAAITVRQGLARAKAVIDSVTHLDASVSMDFGEDEG